VINKLLDNYKKIYSSKKIIKNFSSVMKIFIFVILPVSFVIAIIDKPFKINNILKIIIIIIILIIYLFSYTKSFNRVIKKTFGCSNMIEFNNMRKTEFIEKSDVKNLNDNQLKFLIEYIKNYSEKLKAPYFIKTGSILAIFIPVYSSFVNRIYTNYLYAFYIFSKH
jgi:uncharacterized protein YutD